MKLHTGDTVLVITGKDRGKTGTVVRVLAEENRVVVEGVNMRTRHIRKTPQQAGQKVRFEASIHASNVMVLDPKTKKPTRIHMRVDAKTGKKERVAAKSGEVIVRVALPKAKPAKEKQAAEAEPAAPKKKEAFWKRSKKAALDGAPSDEGDVRPDEKGGAHPTTVHRQYQRESS
ncbi:MAG: large subunit ribosomal protein L24 [Candidatus Peregrinibacteria bacterium Gr01-1014_25]|nr:MAG: large subunit ribosomal protein L24 [Candidatus Peregrinibacteria bacterium Gr01-1014_25]